MIIIPFLLFLESVCGAGFPTSVDTGKKPILVILKMDPESSKCVESTHSMAQVIKSRLEGKGYALSWISEEELSVLPLSENTRSLSERVEDSMKKRKIENALIVQCFQTPLEDADSVHVNEKNYTLSSELKVGGMSLQSKETTLREVDVFPDTEVKLVTSLFAQLDTQNQKKNILLSEKEEFLIAIRGFKNFSQYVRIKALLQAQIKDTLMEDRKISRAEIVFSVRSLFSAEELTQQISQLLQTTDDAQSLRVVKI